MFTEKNPAPFPSIPDSVILWEGNFLDAQLRVLKRKGVEPPEIHFILISYDITLTGHILYNPPMNPVKLRDTVYRSIEDLYLTKVQERKDELVKTKGVLIQ